MIELLAGAVPAALETVTVMVYLLPGSSCDIVRELAGKAVFKIRPY